LASLLTRSPKIIIVLAAKINRLSCLRASRLLPPLQVPPKTRIAAFSPRPSPVLTPDSANSRERCSQNSISSTSRTESTLTLMPQGSKNLANIVFFGKLNIWPKCRLCYWGHFHRRFKPKNYTWNPFFTNGMIP